MTSWLDPVTQLQGVGPKRAQLLQKLGILSIADLMFHFPFRYEDLSVRSLDAILDQEKVALEGKIVTEPVVSYFGRARNRLVFRLAVDTTDVIQVVFFNQAYLKKQLTMGATVVIYGKWEADRQSLIGMRLLSQNQQSAAGVYPTTKGLSQKVLSSLIRQAFDDYGQQIPELIPQVLNDRYQMMPLASALYEMHFSTSEQAREQAVRKIIYYEFFYYQWRIQAAQYQARQQEGIRVFYEVDELRQIIDQLPYELTQAQKQAINDCCYDLMAPYPMQRLLQGDVGSGKTLVAFVTMIATVLGGYQAALMVPTEILAKQHVASFNELFEPIGLRAELLVSGLASKEKKTVLEGLAKGRIRIVIGTHALIQEQVAFKQLAYVLIDEQHRFGVNQRQDLLNKQIDGARPNLLQMTATPIPRSLALSMYGELSVSTIDEYPKGRQPITTYVVSPQEIDQVYQRIRTELAAGHQVYYVLPLIDESEELSQVESVRNIVDQLHQVLPQATIGQLHGQMTRPEQELAMEAFVDHQIDLLVATTMVEVGVDVGNATVMVIHSAERFGLAQLHQLRGRVGRSHLASYCYLVAQPTTDQGRQRMEIMATQSDGFAISQEDMQIRGMGNILGQEQSGLPSFHYANIVEDAHVLAIARQDVVSLLRDTTPLTSEELEQLQQWLEVMQIEL